MKKVRIITLITLIASVTSCQKESLNCGHVVSREVTSATTGTYSYQIARDNGDTITLFINKKLEIDDIYCQ